MDTAIFISDTHFGCRLGLCPPQRVKLDDGGTYEPSVFQKKVYKLWDRFHNDWVPMVARKEAYHLVHVGDAIEGVHHGTKTQISENYADQLKIAKIVMEPIVAKCLKKGGKYFHIRGTEAHVGKSGEYEEILAQMLGATPDDAGHYARYSLRLQVGKALVDVLHHIGVTSSSAHEASAVNAEFTATQVDAARWGKEAPDYIIRGHRHRSIIVEMATERGRGAAIVLPGWQGKTPIAWKAAGSRVTDPQFGGAMIKQGNEEHYHRYKIWTLDSSRIEC